MCSVSRAGVTFVPLCSAWHLPGQPGLGDLWHLETQTFHALCLRSVSLTSPAAIQDWGQDAVGQGKNLLTQRDVLRVTRVGLTPTPGSCWVPEAAGKWDWRVGVCLCWWPWSCLTAPTTGFRDSRPCPCLLSPAWQPCPGVRRSLGRGRNRGGTVGLARRKEGPPAPGGDA